MKTNFIIFIALLIAAGSLHAQTNQGTDFWLAETSNYGCRGDFAISIANPNGVLANAVIDHVVDGPLAVVIAPGGLETHTFPCRAIQTTGTSQNPVYNVTSDVDVVVYTFNPLANAFTNDASLILPVPSLGQNHRVGSYRHPTNNSGTLYGVVAVEDNTNVQSFNNAGAMVDNVIIDKGDYFQRVENQDMTGWSVVTDKPAAVFTGSRCTALGNNSGACDHLDEQVIPEEAMATTYVACPSLTRPIGCNPLTPGSCSPDHFRYIATEDNTTVSTSPAVAGGVINKGDFLQVETSVPHIVSADKPIYGYQYMISQYSGPPVAGTGDPALFGIPPVEQFQFSYIFLTPNTYANDFINVVAPVGTSLSLDGAPVADACNSVGFIGGTEYCCFGKAVADGVHTISADQQFGLSVTGFDQFASYAYIGGVGVQPINAGCDTGGPYQEVSCDAPSPVQFSGIPTCADDSVPLVNWSSIDGLTFDDSTIADPVATVPGFGTFGFSLNVTCGVEDPVQCTSTVELIEQTVGCNEPPEASAGSGTGPNGEYEGDEGSAVVLDAAGSSDPDGDPLSYLWTTIDGSGVCDDLTSASPSCVWPDDGSFSVCVTVDDGNGESDTACSTAVIANVPPDVGSITTTIDLIAISDEVCASADFTDAGTADTHTADWDWGDISTSPGSVTQGAGSGSVGTGGTDCHTYSEAGVYTIEVTVTDDDGDSDASIHQFVVVYDPAAGFVTGGGWIDSPPGALVADLSLTGRANFGFVSKYKKGRSTPEGSTEFQFKAGDMNFHSNTYEWLVVTSYKATFKGVGTINGAGDFGFMLKAIDEKLTPSTDVDKFSIKIWDKDNGDAVVYDNSLGAADDADPPTSISGGQIVIHKK